MLSSLYLARPLSGNILFYRDLAQHPSGAPIARPLNLTKHGWPLSEARLYESRLRNSDD